MKLFGFAFIVAAHGESLGDRIMASFANPHTMPLRKEGADQSAFLHSVGSSNCDQQFGHRYQLNGARIPILMFNNQGDIAGVQIAVNTQEFPFYPDSNLKAHSTVEPTGLSQDEGDWGLTVYFKDPTKMCSAHERASASSVGDRLWVAKADEPSGYLQVPLRTSADELFDGRFKSSACAPSGFAFPGSPGMGLHYWSMDDHQGNTGCVDSLPVFFLYDKGVLQGLGIGIIGRDFNVPTVGMARPTGWQNREGQLGSPNSEILEWPRQPLDPYLFAKGDIFKCDKHVNMFDNSEFGDVAIATLHLMFQDWSKITCEGHEDRIFNHTMGHAMAVV